MNTLNLERGSAALNCPMHLFGGHKIKSPLYNTTQPGSGNNCHIPEMIDGCPHWICLRNN